MLFNTLAYARFFAVVFLASWVLVDRRWAGLLPWLALAGYSVFAAPSAASRLATVAAGLFTWWICRRTAPNTAPSVATVAVCSVVNLATLTGFTLRASGTDPLSLALVAMGLPAAPNRALALVLLAAAAVLLATLARLRNIRLIFLLVASYIFYAHWDPRFLPLIWGSSTIDWWLGKMIGRTADPRRRKQWLAVTVVLNLGILGFFKYCNFGIDSARSLLLQLGIAVEPRTLSIALPVGISFFTFESMSYVIDVYRKHLEPHDSYLEYLGFVAFFPHLVAGPIIRPRDLLPQLAAPARFLPEEASQGLYLIATGLLKKVAISDVLSTNLVDRVFDAPFQYSALEIYVAVVAYSVQIYCDFSGYTDIAIGSASLLGIRFPPNFNAPFQATNIADFWHRWHISLSTWLRDYLYISLGGNRKGVGRTYLNSMITMVLGGLWHGASWTYVVWGAIHGVALVTTQFVQRLRGKRPALAERHPALRVLCIFLTFHLLLVTWVFFRAETFGKAALIFHRLASFTTYHPNLHPLVLGTVAVGLVAHFIPISWDVSLRNRFARLPAPVQGLALYGAAVMIRQMATTDAVPFVYFQF